MSYLFVQVQPYITDWFAKEGSTWMTGQFHYFYFSVLHLGMLTD